MKYASDLTDSEWELIKDYFKKRDNRGVEPTHDRRDIVDAILYVVKTGCQWYMLPNDYPNYKTVHEYFMNWSRDGIWEEALDELNRVHRKKKDKKETPSYGIIDSQSVKTVIDSEDIGFDGGKKVKGRKRHIVVDTLGNLIAIIVHAANIHDTKGGCEVLKQASEKHSTIEAFSGDAGYRKTALEFVENVLGLKLHISQKIKDVFAILPKRWIVERTFAWLGNYRRLSKDYEKLLISEENMVRIAMLRITARKCV
jgi:putative transposase